MTTNDEWVRERAAAVRGSAPWHDRSLAGPIEAALHDAIERGKAEAVAARGEEYGHIIAGVGYREGCQSVLARLENPDEAMLLRLVAELEAEYPDEFIQGRPERLSMDGKFDLRWLCRALALTLTGQENTDG